MSFSLSFPGHQDAEPYTGLIEEHEVYDAILEETRKAISDMGSDGYDLIWPAESGKTGEEVEAWLESLTEQEAEQATLDAHERGIEAVVTRNAPSIFHDLWVRYQTTATGMVDTADEDNTTYSELPDGTKLALREE